MEFVGLLLGLAIIALPVWIIIRWLRGTKTRERYACRSCGTVGPAQRRTKGSIWIEVVLWLCFLVPGLIYSIWRLTTRYTACAACGSAEVVPADTPVGRAIVEGRSQIGGVRT